MRVITIGRSSQNEIRILDPKVSRHHLQIIQNDDGTYIINDLGSTNGTFVNGTKISGENALGPDDVVRIGNTVLPWKSYFNSAPERVEPPAEVRESADKEIGSAIPTPEINDKSQDARSTDYHDLIKILLWFILVISALALAYNLLSLTDAASSKRFISKFLSRLGLFLTIICNITSIVSAFLIYKPKQLFGAKLFLYALGLGVVANLLGGGSLLPALLGALVEGGLLYGFLFIKNRQGYTGWEVLNPDFYRSMRKFLGIK